MGDNYLYEVPLGTGIPPLGSDKSGRAFFSWKGKGKGRSLNEGPDKVLPGENRWNNLHNEQLQHLKPCYDDSLLPEVKRTKSKREKLANMFSTPSKKKSHQTTTPTETPIELLNLFNNDLGSDSVVSSATSDMILPLNQTIETDAIQPLDTSTVFNETSTTFKKKRSLRRTLSKVFSFRKDTRQGNSSSNQSNEEDDNDDDNGNISRFDNKDPMPFFTIKSLRLDKSIDNCKLIRPPSPNYNHVVERPAYEKIFYKYNNLGIASTQFEGFEKLKPTHFQMSLTWNVWQNILKTINYNGSEMIESRYKVIDKVWNLKQINDTVNRFEYILQPTDLNNGQLMFFKYGINPQRKKDPLLSKSGKLTIRIPYNKLKLAWESLIPIVLKDDLMWCNLDNTIVGISWAKAAKEKDNSYVSLWLSKTGYDETSINNLLNEVMLRSPTELKPLFKYTKYYTNLDDVYHTLDNIDNP